MSTTILQTVVARCREDFTTTSATAALVSGTQRLLSVAARDSGRFATTPKRSNPPSLT